MKFILYLQLLCFFNIRFFRFIYYNHSFNLFFLLDGYRIAKKVYHKPDLISAHKKSRTNACFSLLFLFLYDMVSLKYYAGIRHLLDEKGYRNSGITIRWVSDGQGTRDYMVLIHHRKIEGLDRLFDTKQQNQNSQ